MIQQETRLRVADNSGALASRRLAMGTVVAGTPKAARCFRGAAATDGATS